MTIAILFIILSLVCFIAAAAGLPENSRVNMMALGLVFLTVFFALNSAVIR
jgi:hypothetical protein